MYKLVKDAGNNSTVILRNTEEASDLEIGRISVEMLNILEEAGHTFKEEDGSLRIKAGWDLELTHETASRISKLAMPMKKPIRVTKPKVEPKKDVKEVDALDVLLGLATYD